MAKKTQSQYSADYNAKNYDQITARIPHGGKDPLQKIAKNSDKSVNAFIIRAIRQTLQDDGIDPETIRTICGD